MTQLAATLFIVLMSLISAALGLWVSDVSPPVENVIYTPEDLTVAAGKALGIRVRLNRLRICVTTTERILYDGKGTYWRFPTSTVPTVGPIGPDDYRLLIDIPATAAPGASLLRTYISWECNPWHRFFPIRAVNPEVRFTIEDPKK